VACSSSTPTSQNIKTSILNLVQSELSGNQKIVSVSVLEIQDKPGHAELEEPGTENKFWTVTSDIKIKTTVAKKKLPLFKKKYEASTKTIKRKFRVWNNSQKKWVATPI